MFPRSMKYVHYLPSLKEWGWALSPIAILLYQLPRHQQLFNAILKEKVDQLNRNNFLSNNQYAFFFSADVLTFIMHKISEVLDKKSIVYRKTSKNIDDQSLAADLSPDFVLHCTMGKNWFVTLNTSKHKLVTFHHHSRP